ncbi:MaoC family dehydratase [Belnapia rosea]|uniref:N-terminal half of MaoC dehydratase n=1 Tax=Belnapia rosea TaxID=938405 RepID=A0A1G6WBF6_9PROT|nr:MaoC family dehydratase [Belnapia rosea]SDB29734.1 N-terminal half of MaoC dehydratase [Belnapia rosea]SDD63171.1 N-terminal half of MaoC dehydratase [Belnapia rosea]
MPINYDQLMNYPIPEVRQTLRWQDVALYNFSIGLGQDPMDEQQLDFVYESRLKVMPSMPVVLASPGFWARNADTGLVWQQILHGEQGLILHKPLPTEGELIGRSRITGIVDRGEGKGALMYSEREILDGKTGERLATTTSTSFLRGNGGFGGPSGPVKQPHPEPQRAPDITLDMTTRPEQALVYRLNADLNPLHIDPEVAKQAGFPRPILHGLCTFGTVCHALLRAMCGYDTTKFGAMDLRFSSPVFPGETIRTEIWQEEGGAAFRARVVERDKQVISNGRFRFAA